MKVADHPRPLRLAVISKSNAAGGGASRVAEDLALFLNERDGVVVHHWVGYRGSAWHSHMRPLFGGRWFQKVHTLCRFFSRSVGLPDFFTPEIFHLSFRNKVDYDLYHFHDICTTFSPIALRWLAKRKPVVWTFHDCSPFTGGCLYPMECTAFHIRCGACPQLQSWPQNTARDMTGVMQSYKRVTAKAGLFVPIAPSNWMADEAMKSGMFTQRPRIIPYCVDTDLFRPYPKPVARELLGLPKDSFIVLVSAMFLGDHRKGSKYASLALESCERPISVVVVGHQGRKVMELFQGQRVQFTGYLREARVLAQYYAAADVFLFPTLADNLPLSVLETMAAGTPTIGFRTGGLPDMLEHRVSGWLTEPKDVRGLVQGLHVSIDHPEVLRNWAEEGWKKAEKLFSRQAFIDSHLGLYREILEGRYPSLSHFEMLDHVQRA